MRRSLYYALGLGFALSVIFLGAALAHAQHSAYSAITCYRPGSNAPVIEEVVDVETEGLRVRPTDYIRVVREGESVVYFGLGPLWCRAVRAPPGE